ncbi:MAG: DNA/RNA non-specific endonuclease [Salinisphaera sp.]|nr:DNA/RNA non-specific endonuclease [Salinisphaera sp.]
MIRARAQSSVPSLFAALLLALAQPGHAREPNRALAGLPQTAGDHVLINDGFTVGYSERLGSPLWVVYRASRITNRRYSPRPRFHRDPRSRRGVTWFDYLHSGYDRGHMAPNFLMSNLYGRGAQRDSFLMTNVTLQSPRLNQLLWQRLEEVEADYLAPRWQALWVTAGPIFSDADRHTESGLAIPEAFYRLWLDRKENGRLRALALIVPQKVRGDERLDRFVVSVDAVERRTGLDFYTRLPDAEENPLEAAAADPVAWGLTRHACDPARYAENWQGRDGITLVFDRCRNVNRKGKTRHERKD